MSHRPWHPNRDHFEIAVLCALQIESDAVEAAFDKIYDGIANKVENDFNSYRTGRIGDHYIVLAYLAGIGKGFSASTAANIRITFPRIKLCLVVGICGGVPTINKSDGSTEILLGDVIISTEVIQYDRGKQLENRVVRKKTLQESLPLPNMEIRSFEAKMQGLTGRKRLRDSATKNLIKLLKEEGLEAYGYPGADKDRLYEPTYHHKHHDPTACNICAKDDEVCDTALELPCDKLGCDTNKQVPRQRLKKPKGSSANASVPTIEESAEVSEHREHFGKFASGDLVLKSARHRDDLASEDGVIAFDMEGAGVWINLPTVVIKSVCDYADSHKGDAWQKYAAARAAACMRAFVTEWSPTIKTLQNRVNGEPVAEIHVAEEAVTESALLDYRGQKNRNAAIGLTDQILDAAYTLLERQDKKSITEDREAALQVFLQIQADLLQLETFDNSLLVSVYWGLMRVEMDLSLLGQKNLLEKIKHAGMAEKYRTDAAQAMSQSGHTGRQLHLTLYHYIIKGRKASLEFRKGADVDNVRKSVNDAIKGISGALKELEKIDQVRYKKNVKWAREWRRRFESYLIEFK